MNDNSKVITALCSHIGAKKDVIVPLEPGEWGKLAADLNQNGLQPVDLPGMTDVDMSEILQLDHVKINQIHRLLDRAPSLAFEIDKLENRGIRIVTRADKEYPRILKKKLESRCPPLFYAAGDLSLCNQKTIGFVGSRSVSADDLEFTKSTVHKVLQAGYGVVSGGAKGIDQISMQEALSSGGWVICYTADSLLKKIKDKATLQGIMEGRIVLLSVAKPDAGFNVGMAMMRNKYIYAQSDGTVVVRSDKGKGGTWAGAVENLASNPIWCLPFCWNKEYEGNQALIEKGCIPIDENWDVDLKTARHQYIAKSEKSTSPKERTGTIVAESDDNSMGEPMQLNLLDLVEE